MNAELVALKLGEQIESLKSKIIALERGFKVADRYITQDVLDSMLPEDAIQFGAALDAIGETLSIRFARRFRSGTWATRPAEAAAAEPQTNEDGK